MREDAGGSVRAEDVDGTAARRGKEAGPVAGVIPCAGRSRRMGTSKALLDAEGRPFLTRVVEALRGGGCDPVVVVVRPDPAGVQERELALGLGGRVVVNPDAFGGPISSVRRALEALTPLDPDAIVLHPVDHPLVRAGTVAALIEAFRGDAPPVATPTWGGRRGHPVLFARSVFRRLRDPGLPEGARTVVRGLGDAVRSVPVEDPGIHGDIDSPSDYRAAFDDEAP